MSNITKFTKTTAAGNKGVIIIPAEEHYQRLSNLPANWQRARIALSLSWTNLTQDNGTPTADSRNVNLGAIGEFAIGLSNGVGALGQAGNRFVGMVFRQQEALFFALSAGTWRIANSAAGTAAPSLYPRIGDGTSLLGVNGIGPANSLANTDPVATTAFCFHVVVDLTVSAAGSLTAGMAFAASQSDPTIKGFLLSAVPSMGVALAGGWWSAGGSPTPVDCRHLYIRSPFPLNRLRVLDSEIRLLA